jgi:hypothetical protein
MPKVTQKRPTGKVQKLDKRALDVDDLRAFVQRGQRAQQAVDAEIARAWAPCPGTGYMGGACRFEAQTRGGVRCGRCAR